MTVGPGVFALRTVTDTIPIVLAAYGASDELISLGIIASLAHPGGNVTGETFLLRELFVKRIELLKQVKPAMTSVGVLVVQGSSFNQFFPSWEPRSRRSASRSNRSKSRSLPIATAPSRPVPAHRSAGSWFPRCHNSPSGPAPPRSPPPPCVMVCPRQARSRSPAPAAFSSYCVDPFPMARRAAYFVDKILKGTKPGDIPIEQATKFLTVVISGPPRRSDLDIPPTLLAAADEVIE